MNNLFPIQRGHPLAGDYGQPIEDLLLARTGGLSPS